MAWIKMEVNTEGHPYQGSPFPDPLSLRAAKTIYSNMPATLPGVLGNSGPRATEPLFNQGKILETKELRLMALL
jgi:hypothetical protein